MLLSNVLHLNICFHAPVAVHVRKYHLLCNGDNACETMMFVLHLFWQSGIWQTL